jgi:hypothetical protein
MHCGAGNNHVITSVGLGTTQNGNGNPPVQFVVGQ